LQVSWFGLGFGYGIGFGVGCLLLLLQFTWLSLWWLVGNSLVLGVNWLKGMESFNYVATFLVF